jgi:hypothetical protein
MQKFTLVLKHKLKKQNKVAYALSRIIALLVTLQSEVIIFEHLRALYSKEDDYQEVWEKCVSNSR